MFYRIFFLMKTVREDSENKILIYKKHPVREDRQALQRTLNDTDI